MKRRNIIVIIAVIIVVILLISKCNCKNNQSQKTAGIEKKEAQQFIHPPIKQAQVPFSEFEVDAVKGDTIFYNSGSVLIFPSDAFVDKEGKLITGKVNIQYREFIDPVDFFLSGIPMNYDSAGLNYTFESAGMCEITALQKGNPVFVNQKRKPEINIASDNTDPAQNLYYLDTAEKIWKNRGKSEIFLPGKKAVQIVNSVAVNEDIPVPVKPEKANNEMPTITVLIDPESFEELKSYNNLKFQLDKTDKNFDPNHSKEIWEDIKLMKGNRAGAYDIQFSKTNKSVRYKVRPVLSDKDYAKAMQVYDSKIKAYQNKIKDRIASNKENKAAYIKDSLRNIQIEKENARTAAMNKIIEKRNAEIEKINADIENNNKLIRTENLNNRVLRSFALDNFGIWNCDRPISGENNIVVEAQFSIDGGGIRSIDYAYLFVKKFNGLFAMTDERFAIPVNRENMIVAVVDGRFAYISYDEFKMLRINSASKKQVFPLHLVAEKNNNYTYIRSLINQ
jgi:hypothetical protein